MSDPIKLPLTPLQSPLAIMLLSILSMLGTGWVKDRLALTSDTTSSAVRIEQVDRRLIELSAATSSREETRIALNAIEKRLDDLRADIRDLKQQRH